ncbi:histidine phosphatase family protein [Bradyrhizobium macuxiense]|uniref:Histidine phosphatase family protein n=1 Tax=Bradyrhizobium macuxiense TaxID=1755647 RepID=A0A109K080_9BRAD|nr:histidine phosphatase family protein [Bradyrhizobium macuxiense]KWV58373.1 histidine phosphatase family protein [Bradyrhizobium macuxiense]
MDALTLFIIRHAEKPGDAWPGPGFMANGVSDTESLVIRGWQRVGAWTALFGTALTAGDYAKPDAIFAATPGSDTDPNQGPSRRPAETISALAARLAITPNEGFGKGDEKALVNAVLALKGVALVCWEHKAIISDIIPRIPVSKGKPPTKWDGSRFDVVLRFDRAKGDDKFAFKELFPKLLSGDSDKPLDG